jgi:ATP-dependent Zn protease
MNRPARVAGRTKPTAFKMQAIDKAVPTPAAEPARDEMPESSAPPPGEPRPRQDPAEVAATILLEWAMLVQALSTDELRCQGAITIVMVPTGEWAKPAWRAWQSSISGREGTASAARFSGFYRDSPQTVAFVRGEAPSKHDRKGDEETIAEVIWRGKCAVGFAPDVEWLASDLVAAADHRLTMNRLYAGAASELARRLTGSDPTVKLTEDEAAAATPRLLRLARRPEQTADQYLSKLRDLIRAITSEESAAKEKAPTILSPRDCLTLDRLAGMEEAVHWGTALAKDLADFRAGQRAWAEVDKGLLLSGPPGCGKTAFGQALARTCGVPLIEGSWSRWLANGTGHQGDFMLALKRTFADARAQAPCILFLDEVDSFPNRGTLTHAQKDWDIQVINALLAERDGAEARPGVVVVGACNNPHLLDPALLRSGRLDRHVRIGLPDRSALSLIIREHLGGDLAGEDLHSAALLAFGSTGADVERLVRGARRRARTADRPMILADLLGEIGGKDRRTPEELLRSAVHEAGHAVAASEIGMAVRAVTIRLTDGDGGFLSCARRSCFSTDHDIHDELVCLLAGRAAEQVVLGEPSDGCGGDPTSDLALATRLAARALSEFGFDGERGLLWQPVPERQTGLSDAMSRDPGLSTLVRRRLADAYSDASALIDRRRSAGDAVASALLIRTALDGEEVARILDSDRRGDRP